MTASVVAGGLAVGLGASPVDAAVNLTQPPDTMIGTMTPSANAATEGMFSPLQNWPLVPMHMSLLPSGKVVTYGSPTGQAAQNGAQIDNWDPAAGYGPTAHRTTAPFSVNSFCNIAKIGADGKLLFVGGNTPFAASTYDGGTEILMSSVNALQFPRWYASMVRLPDDRMVVVGGSQPYAALGSFNNGDNSATAPTPEVFTPGGGWSALPGATSTAFFGGANNRWWYPKAYVAPDGNVVGISHEQVWKLNPTGGGSIVGVGVVPGTGVGASAASVMYEPGKILLAGGGQRADFEAAAGSTGTTLIDITGAGAQVTPLAPMARARNWGTMTVLPNGEVFMNGGTSFGLDAASAVFQAEIWNPTTRTWRNAATATRIRTYHSASLLLPSGAVLTGGGGVPGPQVNFNVETYFPPSLFTRTATGSAWADRNEIRSLAGDIAYGKGITLGMKDSRTMSSMSLISLGSVTHSYNADLRRIPLTFTQAGNAVTATIPTNRNILPPGHYQLQGVDANGVPTPSQIIEIRRDGLPGAVTVYGTGPTTPPPPTTPSVPLTVGSQIGLEAVNIPGSRIRHAGFTGFLSAVSETSDLLSRQDSSFIVRAGLARPACVSFESVNYPGHFLRNVGQRLVLSPNDGTALFAQGASFCPQPGLAGTGTSFQSVSFPGQYIRHRDFAVYVEASDGTDLSKLDASFNVRPALAITTAGKYWAVGTDNNVYRWNGTTWLRVGVNAREISVGVDGTVLMTDRTTRAIQRYVADNNWARVGNGAGLDVAVVRNNVYFAIGTDNNVYRWNGTTWLRVGVSASSIAAGSDGTVLVTNRFDRSIWRYVADNNWTRVGNGAGLDVAVVRNNVYFAIGTDNNVYRWNGTTWLRVGVSASSISATADGTVLMTNRITNAIWKYDADNSWSLLPGGGLALDIATR